VPHALVLGLFVGLFAARLVPAGACAVPRAEARD
jgi:hypothetical protein